MVRDDGSVDGGVMVFCFVGRCGVWEYGDDGEAEPFMRGLRGILEFVRCYSGILHAT
jgi:hypothetical protein